MLILFLLVHLCNSFSLFRKKHPPHYPQPLDPYANGRSDSRAPPSLLYDFKAYLAFSYSTGCQSIWTQQEFPQGNQFEKDFPSTLVQGFFDSDTTLTAFILYNEQLQSIVISFRPSNTITLWKRDFQFWRSKFTSEEFNQSLSFRHSSLLKSFKASEPKFLRTNSGRNLTKRSIENEEDIVIPKGLTIHHGFKVLYLRFRNEILSITNELTVMFPTYKVVFCGHSLGNTNDYLYNLIELGASLAEIAAVDFAVNGNAPDRLWLFPFASPRTGNRKWAEFVQNLEFARKGRIQRLTRYRVWSLFNCCLIESQDPFPMLPFRFMNYEHVGQEYIIWENNTITKCPPNPDGTLECRIGHTNILSGTPTLHAPRYYMEFLDIGFNCSAPANQPDPIAKKAAIEIRRKIASSI